MKKTETFDLKKKLDELFERVHNGDKEAIEKLAKIEKEMGN